MFEALSAAAYNTYRQQHQLIYILHICEFISCKTFLLSRNFAPYWFENVDQLLQVQYLYYYCLSLPVLRQFAQWTNVNVL